MNNSIHTWKIGELNGITFACFEDEKIEVSVGIDHFLQLIINENGKNF